MAISFANTKGKAQIGAEGYKYKYGENTVRLVGDVLPRYVYWLKGSNDKDIPVECLAFDREAEKFNNKQVDHVTSFFPDKKRSWSYVMLCIDPTDGKVKPINLKKKLFEQILSAAEDLGDPTDPTTGWSAVFKRVKTGPLAYNVEYTLQVLRCKSTPLTDVEKELVAAATPIDVAFPRPTPDEIKALLVRITTGADTEETPAEGASIAQAEAIKEL